MREFATRPNRVRQRLLASQPPSGLVSVRYLLPRLTPSQRVHRSLLASSFPTARRPAAALLNTWHWLRWVGYASWRASSKAVRARGTTIEQAHGVSSCTQLRLMLWCTLAYTIPPRDFYRFELWRPEQRVRLCEYVYGTETAAFHRWRDAEFGPGGDTYDEIALLGDKHRFERALDAVSITTTKTERVLPKAARASALDGLGDGDWFCKPVVGSQAAGVFHLTVDHGRRSIVRLSGDAVEGDVNVAIEQRFAATDYVVQRAVRSHSTQKDLCGRDEAITLRLITEAGVDGSCAVMSAVLEVPGGADGGYRIYAVNETTGAIADDTVDVSHPWVGEPSAVTGAGAMPHWRDTVAAAVAAHALVPNIFGVAWDFIISDDGPVLLEGNTSWSTVAPQRINGPYLSDAGSGT